LIKNHNYRKFKKLCDLEPVKKELKQIQDALDELQYVLSSKDGNIRSVDFDFKGYGIFRLFLSLLVQFIDNVMLI
jgi:hypothetical protein